MPANALLFQLAFSAIVIVAFGYRQFNTWTKGESCRATTDSELLAFAPPRSFTPLWRFLATAALYCLTLVVLYLVVFVMLYNGSMSGDEPGVGLRDAGHLQQLEARHRPDAARVLQR